MAAAGLLRRELAAGTCRKITLTATAAGQKAADWIRGRRRAVLAHELGWMAADGRQALARGLSELAVRQVMPRRDATPPEAHTQEDGTDLAGRPGRPRWTQAFGSPYCQMRTAIGSRPGPTALAGGRRAWMRAA
jgi:hypothetical protein